MNVKAITGLTSKEYAAAHRARRVQNELGRSGTVTEAIFRRWLQLQRAILREIE
jgi:methylphosphotriester-DNA--protein-cysteine methyltransferase